MGRNDDAHRAVHTRQFVDGGHVLEVEPLRQLEVDLQRRQLPAPADGVPHVHVDLGSVERTLAFGNDMDPILKPWAAEQMRLSNEEVLSGKRGMPFLATSRCYPGGVPGQLLWTTEPLFFASSALYPLWRVKESSPALYYVCQFNPFTHAVELIRFALYGEINWLSLAVVAGCTAAFVAGAVMAYSPSRGLLARRGEV